MLTEYIQAAMRHATYKILGDGTYFGEIPEIPGVWSDASTLEAAREELRSVLEDWILIGLRQGEQLPIVDGINLNVPIVA